jgi:phage-related minor tail protein
MTDVKPGFDPADLQSQLNQAAGALQAFAKGPARRAADEVGQSFERAGGRIATSLARAATGGEAAFKRMAKVILEELAKLALNTVFTQLGAKAPFFGARAAGGPVNAGGAYLVGERGPELFVPRGAGEIGAQAGAVSVHFHLSGGADASGIARHQGQIAAAIARAVAYGRRNL